MARISKASGNRQLPSSERVCSATQRSRAARAPTQGTIPDPLASLLKEEWCGVHLASRATVARDSWLQAAKLGLGTVSVVNVAIAIVSLVASAMTIVLFAQLARERDRLSWRVVERSITQVINEMRRNHYEPDVIVGVGRGGAIVAGMLAGNLGHVPLVVLDTILDRRNHVSEVRLRYPELIPKLHGQRVLVCVGELYSGEDLKTGTRVIRKLRPREIKTMSLFSHPATSVEPDFVGRQTRRPLDAPWRITDEYRTKRL